MNEQKKINWQGKILSVQPRTAVWRYVIDNRTHSHLGFNLFLEGEADGEERKFAIAISEKQQQKGLFQIGDIIKGTAWTKKYPKLEYADFYRAGALKHISKTENNVAPIPPPWIKLPPSMDIYEWRGARVLSKASWRGKCFTCIWASMAAVTIEYDWDRIRKYRYESFCYGPKSCKYYKRGKVPMVPYKDRGSFPDDGGLDEIITENRDWDD